MNQITDTIQNIFSDRPLQEDEYRNEADHLIYCAKCKTPRQHHLVVLGKEMVVPIRCRCQQEVQDKEEAERKHREFLDQVSRLKANGLQDKSLREYTFANDKGYNPEMQKAHDYVAHWSEMKAKSIGLLLWGNVGTGKSFFAGCIANALLEQGVPVLMTNFSRILNNEPSGTVLNVRKSMWIHPTLDRAISIREAARLQTFPDSFVFCGSKDKQYQQVGNAVPPIMAKAIAKQLAATLGKKLREAEQENG